MILAQVTHMTALSRELNKYLGKPMLDQVTGDSFCVVQSYPSGSYVYATIRYKPKGDRNWSVNEDTVRMQVEQGHVRISQHTGSRFTTAFNNKLLTLPASFNPPKAVVFDEAGIG